MKSFKDQISEYLASSPSISSLSSKTDQIFIEKYSMNGTGGEEQFNGVFIPGKIYVGKYNTDSKVNEKTRWINRYPFFFLFSEEKIGDEIIIKAIDLNVTPPEYRAQILEKIHNQFSQLIKENSNNLKGSQQPITIKTGDIERLLFGTGYKFSFTGFKKRFLSNVKVVDYSDWPKLVYLNISSIDGQSINSIYNDYKSKL